MCTDNGQKKRGRRPRQRGEETSGDPTVSDNTVTVPNAKFHPDDSSADNGNIRAPNKARTPRGKTAGATLESGRAQTGVVVPMATTHSGQQSEQTPRNDALGSGGSGGLARIRWENIAPEDITLIGDSTGGGADDATQHTYVNDADYAGATDPVSGPGSAVSPGATTLSGGDGDAAMHSYVNDAVYVAEAPQTHADGKRHSYVNDAMFVGPEDDAVTDTARRTPEGLPRGPQEGPHDTVHRERDYVNVSRVRDQPGKSPVGLEYLVGQQTDTEGVGQTSTPRRDIGTRTYPVCVACVPGHILCVLRMPLRCR